MVQALFFRRRHQPRDLSSQRSRRATNRYRSELWSEPFNDIEAVSEWAGPRIGTWASPLTASMTKEETKARQRSNPEAQAIFFRRRHQPRRAIFVMTLHARCVVTSSGPSRRHSAAGRWMICCS